MQRRLLVLGQFAKVLRLSRTWTSADASATASEVSSTCSHVYYYRTFLFSETDVAFSSTTRIAFLQPGWVGSAAGVHPRRGCAALQKEQRC